MRRLLSVNKYLIVVFSFLQANLFWLSIPKLVFICHCFGRLVEKAAEYSRVICIDALVYWVTRWLVVACGPRELEFDAWPLRFPVAQ